jgi:hypothetical protein
MANFFYFDNNATKQGQYDSVQLIALAKNGSITPDTLIENESGKQTKAENIAGLFPRPVPPVPPIAATPCPHCGATVTADEKFCGSCGKSILVPAQLCPHCGTTVAVGEKVCYRCGKSPSQPVKPTVEPVSGRFNTPDNILYDPRFGNTQINLDNPPLKLDNPLPSSAAGFLDIGFTRFLDIRFTRFITPIWLSVIWVICIVSNVISFLASLVGIGIITYVASGNPAVGVFVFLLGLPVFIILHLLSLLFSRIALELIIVLFKIEKNTRGTEEYTRAMLSKQL